MQEVGAWDGDRAPFDAAGFEARELRHLNRADGARHASVTLGDWSSPLDDGRMLDGDDYLKATARTPVALVSATTLASLGLTAGDHVEVSGDRGTVTLPVGVADLPDGVVWTPTTAGSASAGSDVRLNSLGAQA